MTGTVPSRETTMERLFKGYQRVADYRRDTAYTVADRLEERAWDSADKPFVIFEDQCVTFGAMNARANRVVHAALSQGLKRGDVVALLMNNRPEFVMIWLGLAKAGIVTALLNTSATGPVLLHALRQVKASGLIFGAELSDAVASLDRDDLPRVLFCQSEAVSATVAPHRAHDLNAAMAMANDANPSASIRQGIVMADPLYLIFTSGTTGLPKAAKMSHLRFIAAGETMGGTLEFGPQDVHYCVLPLYHGAGGMVIVSISLAFSTPFVLRRRFSVSGFWDDVRRHRITATQYIGEICRYLLNAPEAPNDRDHSLTRMSGAGLKADVWRRFTERFGVERIYEGLGGTECNYTLLNVDGVVGAVGRIPYPEHSTVRVLAYDFDAGTHFVEAAGTPRLAGPGEVGELIAQVLPGPEGAGFFEGYTCPDASEAKLMRDVFEAGDIWFRSGDLVRFDADGYFYFVDRVGDTFRWKSENVSTEEVSLVLGGFEGPGTVNVYGVEVPGTEGRAGMVTLTYPTPEYFDPAAFYAYAATNLAPYAVPVFVRVSREPELTTTFKLRKVDLQRAGYDPGRTNGDPLFVCDPHRAIYVPLTDEALIRLGLPAFVSPQSGDAANAR